MPDRNRSPVVVVTGASAGLGRAIAHAYAARGAKLALLARNPQALDAAVDECMSRGATAAVAIPTDVSDAEAVEFAAEKAESELGPIDIWINNAMVSVFSPVKEMEPSDYKRVTDVLYLGFVYGTMSALKRMLERDRGTIIQIGSALAHRSIPLQSAYCACKHAISGFTDSLRCELKHERSNIKLTQVHMPAMNTWQFYWVKNRLPHNPQPVPPIFQPEVCAQVVASAGYAKNPRREYWVGSSTVKAIVAQKFMPGLLDRYLGRTGYKSQQIQDEPRSPEAQNNLYHYVPGIDGTRGRFDDRARQTSAEVSLSLHRNWLAAGAAVLLAGAILIARKRIRL